ncbi:MAG: tRNA pseudouridine(55) synthase TruB [Rickettsiales bacterium]|jgi:tRNA pseudouridine55 synthase|nr:tRNA pseudouridine(55) synthase TruB [Rickettsiales bacterium]
MENGSNHPGGCAATPPPLAGNLSGWVILDKHSGVNSRAVGNAVRKLFGADTFGHIGTLDPMASGVLVVALGEATKLISFMAEHPKVYEFSVRFGMRTDTDDITGRVLEEGGRVPELCEIEAACAKLIGRIMQRPPAYSAVHINGKRAYELARAGACVDMPEREVEVFELDVKKSKQHFSSRRVKSSISGGKTPRSIIYTPSSFFLAAGRFSLGIAMSLRFFARLFNYTNIPGKAGRGSLTIYPGLRRDDDNKGEVGFRVKCGTGTYVRSLARDIAALCGTCATCTSIRRVESNGFSVENAITLEKLQSLVDNQDESVGNTLLPMDFVLGGIPVVNLNSDSAMRFRNGGFVKIDVGNFEQSLFRVYYNNAFIGIGEFIDELLRPKKVIKG